MSTRYPLQNEIKKRIRTCFGNGEIFGTIDFADLVSDNGLSSTSVATVLARLERDGGISFHSSKSKRNGGKPFNFYQIVPNGSLFDSDFKATEMKHAANMLNAAFDRMTRNRLGVYNEQ
jgi:hypothetical protein